LIKVYKYQIMVYICVTKANNMTDLKQLSVDHLNESVKVLSENNLALSLAEITKDKNSILKLRFQRKSLLSTIDYWRAIVNQENNLQ
jgi:hypothetical protein